MGASNIILLMGGGLDSSYAAFNLFNRGNNIIGLHFDYGQVSAPFEKRAVLKISEYLGIKVLLESFDFPTIKYDYEIKGRNLLLILASAPVALKNNCYQIVIGVHKGSPYYDASKFFLQDAQKLMDGYFGGGLQINAPLINLTKPEIWKLAINEKFNIDITYSCQNGKETGCGKCPSCRDREVLNAY